MDEMEQTAKNVLGGPLKPCSMDPLTGFYRTGYCETGDRDLGMHTVCAEVTEAFLEYSRQQGNDLVTPNPVWGFPGLKAGDRWCVCASRWLEAYRAGCAPPVVLAATHAKTTDVIPMEVLRAHACG